jgi:UDP:flavonoid glycosyltransferase YjiC (YdhE family)
MSIAVNPIEQATGARRQRIVLTTFGSLGDIHPYIAVSLGLQARGHEAVIATSSYYREKIEALGIGFRPLRPDHPDADQDTGLTPTAYRRQLRVFIS